MAREGTNAAHGPDEGAWLPAALDPLGFSVAAFMAQLSAAAAYNITYAPYVSDCSHYPGTGTPEVAGLLPHEALGFLRALAGLRFTGFDVVEVSPPYDGPGQATALHGAAVAYELLALTAVA